MLLFCLPAVGAGRLLFVSQAIEWRYSIRAVEFIISTLRIFSPVMSSCLIKCVIRVKQTVVCSIEVGGGGGDLVMEVLACGSSCRLILCSDNRNQSD